MNIATHKQRRNSVEEAGGKFKALRISDKFVLILHILFTTICKLPLTVHSKQSFENLTVHSKQSFENS